MKADYLAYRNAEKLVQSYAHEWDDLVARHAEAMDFRNGEALLQMGIEAFEWLLRADQAMREAIYEKQAAFDAEFERALADLCQGWLATARRAAEWISKQAHGHEIANLSRFRSCLEEMEAIVQAGDAASAALPPGLAKLRDAAVDEQRHGKTAEFI